MMLRVHLRVYVRSFLGGLQCLYVRIEKNNNTSRSWEGYTPRLYIAKGWVLVAFAPKLLTRKFAEFLEFNRKKYGSFPQNTFIKVICCANKVCPTPFPRLRYARSKRSIYGRIAKQKTKKENKRYGNKVSKQVLSERTWPDRSGPRSSRPKSKASVTTEHRKRYSNLIYLVKRLPTAKEIRRLPTLRFFIHSTWHLTAFTLDFASNFRRKVRSPRLGTDMVHLCFRYWCNDSSYCRNLTCHS